MKSYLWIICFIYLFILADFKAKPSYEIFINFSEVFIFEVFDDIWVKHFCIESHLFCIESHVI